MKNETSMVFVNLICKSNVNFGGTNFHKGGDYSAMVYNTVDLVSLKYSEGSNKSVSISKSNLNKFFDITGK